MRPLALRRRLLCAGFGAILAGATLGTGVAKADPAIDQYTVDNAPAICSMLDDNPTTDGIANVGVALMDKGLTGEQAGEVVARAIVGWCPDHMAQLEAFLAKYSEARKILR